MSIIGNWMLKNRRKARDCNGSRSGVRLPSEGTEDKSDAGDRYRALLPDCNFMFVYDANCAIGAARPKALAFIALEFFERRDLFLVSRESGITLP